MAAKEELQSGRRKLLRIMDIFIILPVVVLQVGVCVLCVCEKSSNHALKCTVYFMLIIRL